MYFSVHVKIANEKLAHRIANKLYCSSLLSTNSNNISIDTNFVVQISSRIKRYNFVKD